MKRPSTLALTLMVGFLIITVAAIFSQWERVHPDPFTAASQGQAGHLSFHLARGQDPNARNAQGESLLRLALGPQGSYAAVALLIERDAAVQEEGELESLLGLAVLGNKLREVQLLLKSGSDANATDRLGRSPGHRVQSYGFAASIVAELLRAGADLDLKDQSGLSVRQHLQSLGLEEIDQIVESAQPAAQ